MKVDMISGMNFLDYRAKTDFVSISELKLFADSPYSYKQKYLDKAQPEEYKPSGAQQFGTLAHCLFLEPDTFQDQYYISDVRKDERTKIYQAVKEDAKGKAIISPNEFDRASAVTRATFEECARQKLDVATIDKEVSVFIEHHKMFLLKTKGRYDLYDRNNEIIFDYKTTDSVPDHETIERQVLNYRYHWQAAFYWDLHKAATGRRPKDFVWIFQQTTFPFACAIYWTNQEIIDIGRIEYKRHLKELRDAIESKEFPVLRRQPKFISLPKYYVSKYITNCDVVEKGENKNGI